MRVVMLLMVGRNPAKYNQLRLLVNFPFTKGFIHLKGGDRHVSRISKP